MKKTFLFTLALFMTVFSFANSITIINSSSATVVYSLRGEVDPENSPAIFESILFTIPPGEILHFDSPAEVPGLEYLTDDSQFSFIKGYS